MRSEYETRVETYTDSEGNTQTRTRQERVNTHYASTGGTLAATDVSRVFVPNTRLRNCALASVLEVGFDPSFAGQYHREKNMFYSMNTMDTHQEKTERFNLDSMKDACRIEWVPGLEDPWWMNTCWRNISVLTCTAVCWFHAIKKYMGSQTFAFEKKATAFY